jgi:citrate synthase
LKNGVENGVSDGLEGIVAAQTVLSHADGEHGIVWVRGHTIADLVAHHGYEGTIAVLWDGFAGESLTRAGIARQLGPAGRWPFPGSTNGCRPRAGGR